MKPDFIAKYTLKRGENQPLAGAGYKEFLGRSRGIGRARRSFDSAQLPPSRDRDLQNQVKIGKLHGKIQRR